MPYTEYLSIAIKAAQLGGQSLLDHLGNLTQIQVKSTPGDLVTEADLASEKIIIDLLSRHFPEHGIWAEESGLNQSEIKPLTWVIDPLDGTLNYAHSLPFFAVNIALLKDGVPIVAVTYQPVLKECFTAIQGQGAYLNNQRISVSKTDQLSKSFLATGFPYRKAELEDNNYLEFCYFANRTQDIRRPGSAAMDLAYTACGRFDGYWEKHLNPWDIAAGALLVQEAGGQVSAYDGSVFKSESGEILASNGPLHSPMLEGLASCRNQKLKVPV